MSNLNEFKEGYFRYNEAVYSINAHVINTRSFFITIKKAHPFIKYEEEINLDDLIKKFPLFVIFDSSREIIEALYEKLSFNLIIIDEYDEYCEIHFKEKIISVKEFKITLTKKDTNLNIETLSEAKNILNNMVAKVKELEYENKTLKKDIM